MNTALSLMDNEKLALKVLRSMDAPAHEAQVLSGTRKPDQADLRRTLWTLEAMGLVKASVTWEITDAGMRRIR